MDRWHSGSNKRMYPRLVKETPVKAWVSRIWTLSTVLLTVLVLAVAVVVVAAAAPAVTVVALCCVGAVRRSVSDRELFVLGAGVKRNSRTRSAYSLCTMTAYVFSFISVANVIVNGGGDGGRPMVFSLQDHLYLRQKKEEWTDFIWVVEQKSTSSHCTVL
jgi:hypothetical protein